MSTQHEWVDLSKRTEEIQELVMQVVDLTTMGQKEPELVYRECNWGLVQNTILCSSLLEMRKSGKLQNHKEIMAGRGTNSRDASGRAGVQEEVDDNISIRRKPQTVVTRDLSWFIQNGETENIRLKAREYREKLLLDLYLEHVKQTGETYFPQLQQLLEAEWKFKFQGDDNA
jgi:hypothetical protein